MAGMDYLKCENCGVRIMYEPERDPSIKVICLDCYNKMVAMAKREGEELEYRIFVSTGEFFTFNGIHLKDLETENWHYYHNTDTGGTMHFRKEHMVAVSEKVVK